MPPWTTAHLPDLTGRSVIITGSNSGLGFETAKALAHQGAALTLAVRDRSKGDHAAAAIGGDTTAEVLDLSDLDSVREFASAWSNEHPQGLDLLINNAGIMATPQRTSAQGFEMQLATNHLGRCIPLCPGIYRSNKRW